MCSCSPWSKYCPGIEFCQLIAPNKSQSDSQKVQRVDSKNKGVLSLSYGRLNRNGVLPLAVPQLKIEFMKKLEG